MKGEKETTMENVYRFNIDKTVFKQIFQNLLYVFILIQALISLYIWKMYISFTNNEDNQWPKSSRIP